jgi:hypothetical protein
MVCDHQPEAIQIIDKMIIDPAARHDLTQVSSAGMIQYCLRTCFLMSCSVAHVGYGSWYFFCQIFTILIMIVCSIL